MEESEVDCRRFVESICNNYKWCKILLPLVGYLQGFDETHGLPHTVRVLCNASSILSESGRKLDEEKLEDLVIAILLHDIGRGLEELTESHHALLSAELAENILKLLGFNRERINRVKKMILEHSYSLGSEPSSIESCILSDADKLDALGAIGIYRMSVVGYNDSKPLLSIASHYYDKLEKLPDIMCLDVSRRKAREKLKILKKFVEELVEDSLEYEEAIIYLLDRSLAPATTSTTRLERP